MTFAQQLKNARIARELTLRECASALGVDASNWSKMERGINPAPRDTAQLETWANFLRIEGDDKGSFFDLAALSRSEIPADMASDEKVIAALPVFFRAVRGRELNEDNIRAFMEDLRKVESPDPVIIPIKGC